MIREAPLRAGPALGWNPKSLIFLPNKLFLLLILAVSTSSILSVRQSQRRSRDL